MKVLLTVLLLSAISTSAWAGSAPFRKVFIVLLENESEDAAIEQPFLKKLASEGTLIADMRAVAHPSYPNYMALTGGSTFGIHGDGQRTIDASHIGDLLEARGKTWKNYAEDYPGNCYLGST